jgi:transposase
MVKMVNVISMVMRKKKVSEKKLSDTALDWREGRRLRALELWHHGWKQARIAEALGVTPGAVSQWIKRAREAPDGEAVDALRRRKATGAPPLLTAEEREQLPAILEKGPEYYGYLGDEWTHKRVAEVVYEIFGVRYHESHAGRLLKACRLHDVASGSEREHERDSLRRAGTRATNGHTDLKSVVHRTRRGEQHPSGAVR